MKKDIITKKGISLVSILMLFLSNVVVYSVQGQESAVAKIATPAKVQMHIIEPSHPWRPPFGVNRIGRSFEVIVTFRSKEIPAGEFFLAGLLNGKEVCRKKLLLTDKTPFAEIVPQDEDKNHLTLFSVNNPGKKDIAFSGSPAITEKIDQVALIFSETGKAPVELTRQAVTVPSFEAEAVAKHDRVINPVDLGTILVPANWLLLAGGQKAYVTLAVLNRSQDNLAACSKIWYNSAPQNKVIEPLTLNQGNRVQKDLSLPACSKSLQKDILHLSVENAEGKELWHKEIKVMIVQNPPALPSFGVVKTKLRYDSPIINIVDGKNVPLSYDELWKPEFEDVVVCLPNGSRWIFWRGTSYIPVWAGKYNTCLSYEWAERLSPNDGFTDCLEPLMDKELRYSKVEIVESTNSRIHIRWNYQSCDFNYKVNGDLPVEDYYFYPDGFGTRVLTLKSIPEAEYEVSELIILAPQAAFPLNFMSPDPVDIISVTTGEKAIIHLPEADQTWKKISDPCVYRIRLHRDEPLAAIFFNPNLSSKPGAFKPVYENEFLATPAYWGGHWPLSRGFNTMWNINESVWDGPSHNSLMTWASNRPKPVISAVTETKDAFGTLKTMKVETWAWLIGMTDVNDDTLLQITQSYAKPPTLDVSGAIQDPEHYSFERRAMRLVVEKKKVRIMIRPDRWCVNPVFELQNAPEQLQAVKLGGKTLQTDKYAWDGNIFWLNATIDQPVILELLFRE